MYARRREFLKTSIGIGLAGAVRPAPTFATPTKPGDGAKPGASSTGEAQTPLKHIVGYSNFYEFGTDKEDPARHAHRLRTRPWTVTIEGLVKKPVTLDIETILKLAPLEERIYRLRCVEGWSMVIPWLGFPLDILLKQVEPLGSAKYVEFVTALQPDTMPGVQRRMLGLFTFFYAVLHLTSYLWFDQFFAWSEIARDILKRPFITVGMAAFVLLVPLAATSSNCAIRRLGGRRWQALHRTVYAIGILAVLHYSWLVKTDQSRPLLYGGILFVLLGLRAWWREVERREQLAGKYRPRVRNRIIPIQSRN